VLALVVVEAAGQTLQEFLLVAYMALVVGVVE
jgi:hypothetical protein